MGEDGNAHAGGENPGAGEGHDASVPITHKDVGVNRRAGKCPAISGSCPVCYPDGSSEL